MHIIHTIHMSFPIFCYHLNLQNYRSINHGFTFELISVSSFKLFRLIFAKIIRSLKASINLQQRNHPLLTLSLSIDQLPATFHISIICDQHVVIYFFVTVQTRHSSDICEKSCLQSSPSQPTNYNHY